MKRTRIILISIILIACSSNVLAIDNLNAYDPNPSLENSQTFLAKTAPVLGFIRNVGIITSVVVLSMIGLKYMFLSIEEKANYKQTMFPFVVGCFMLMGVSVIVGIIESLSL